MRTHFLGREEVDAYLADLAHRLLSLGNDRLLVWCPIGPSGGRLATELLKLEPRLVAGTNVIPVQFARGVGGASGAVDLQGTLPTDVAGQNVLVLDSSIHSGSTMQATIAAVQAHGPRSIATYTLILKQSSCFIPTYWAVTIHDHDRAYFLLPKVPNNRLDPKFPRDHGHLRRLSEADLATLPPIVSGTTSLDRTTWEDRWWDMQVTKGADSQHYTFLFEICGAVVGYLTYTLTPNSMTIDEVAIAKDLKRKKYGGTLMRWAETVARQSSCAEITLWAIESGVPFYEAQDYRLDQSKSDMTLDGDKFKLMRKKILYHLSPPVR